MKKWVALFWLAVSMLATFFPCCTKDDCGADRIGLPSAAGKERKPDGACSPFVTCGTCAGFTQTARTIELPLLSTFKLVHHSLMLVRIPNTYPASPFQPPRTV